LVGWLVGGGLSAGEKNDHGVLDKWGFTSSSERNGGEGGGGPVKCARNVREKKPKSVQPHHLHLNKTAENTAPQPIPTAARV
jgi:hypothetical protein